MIATPIDRIAARRIEPDAQHAARRAICRRMLIHINPQLVPRYRVGSNSWRDYAFYEILNPTLPAPPCPHCGGDGGDWPSQGQWLLCGSCLEQVMIGDYRWDDPADVRRYIADHAVGQVEQPDDIQCQGGCGRRWGELYEVWKASGFKLVSCDRPDCFLIYDFDAWEAGEAARIERQTAEMRQRAVPRLPRPVALPAPPQSGLAATLSTLEATMERIAAEVGAVEGETVVDARLRNTQTAFAEARERDRRRMRAVQHG